MNCQETRNLIKPFLDGELDKYSTQQVRRHLAACSECACRLDPVDLMEILPILDDSIEPSEDFADRFYAAVDKGKIRNTPPEGFPASCGKRVWLPRWS